MSAEVVLVPGLWMPAAAMRVLGARLHAAGYAVRYFTYAGRAAFGANVERFTSFLRGRRAHLIGHSLGGVLILEALRDSAVPAAGALLLGAPVRGCVAGRRLGAHAAGRWMMGDCLDLWSEREACWQRPEPLGVVAGTAPLGLGRLLGRLPGESDGVVCVDETAVAGMSARALVPVGHSMLIFSPRVAALAERFMRERRFA
ncbi:MAG: esterase/lipase family protein [Betaproteobacteria bacterium]